MINFLANPASLLGIALIGCGVALYVMRTVRPQLSRDHDIFFSAVALITGFILLFQGWLLEPLLLLGQVALAGTAVFFAVENIRMRGITTEQAKRMGNEPIVDDERPVSRVYRAELDDSPYLDYGDERSSRRIRGSRGYGDEPDYYDEPMARPSRRSAPERRLRGSDRPVPDRAAPNDRYGDRYAERYPAERPPSRRRPVANRAVPRLDASRPAPDREPDYAERPPIRTSDRRPLPPEEENAQPTSSYRMRSPRSSSRKEEPRRRPEPEEAGYADYRPLDYGPTERA
jgi:hypothetical protein